MRRRFFVLLSIDFRSGLFQVDGKSPWWEQVVVRK